MRAPVGSLGGGNAGRGKPGPYGCRWWRLWACGRAMRAPVIDPLSARAKALT